MSSANFKGEGQEMKRKHRNCSSSFIMEVVLAALKEEKTIIR